MILLFGAIRRLLDDNRRMLSDAALRVKRARAFDARRLDALEFSRRIRRWH
jgi:hypothetical protein